MKKVIMLLSFALICMSAMCQENMSAISRENMKKEAKKYALETMFGTTTFVNYPGISLFRNDIPSFSDINAGLNFVYNADKKASWELNFAVESVNIPNVEDILSERFDYYSLGLGFRLNKDITTNLNAYFSMRMGFLSTKNVWKDLDNHGYTNRGYGVHGELFMGLKYNIIDRRYITIGVGLPMGAYDFKNNMINRTFEGYSIMIGFGI